MAGFVRFGQIEDGWWQRALNELGEGHALERTVLRRRGLARSSPPGYSVGIGDLLIFVAVVE